MSIEPGKFIEKQNFLSSSFLGIQSLTKGSKRFLPGCWNQHYSVCREMVV